MDASERKSFFNRPLVHVVLIAALGLIVYSNTFDVPFHFDDKDYIENNPFIKNIDNLLEPSRAENLNLPENVRISLKTRYIGYLSFALNHLVNGIDIWGYHVFNLVVHIANALLVYLIAVLTFKTSLLKQSSLVEYCRHIALFSALMFVSHPVQTQAVTYISQRFTSLAAFFYLASLACYIASRRSERTSGRYGFYGASFVCAIIAMKTKEIAFTLPLAITLYEVLFFRGLPGTLKARVMRLVPLWATMLIIPLSLLDMSMPFPAAIAEATQTADVIQRYSYLVTQPRVLATYLRLLFLPVNQNADYDYPVFGSFLDTDVLFSVIVLASVVSLLIYFYRRSRDGREGLVLVVFGGLWFFLALSVESSVIALADVMFEHRLYLPSAGAIIAIISILFLTISNHKRANVKKVVLATLVLSVAIFSCASYFRNTVWKSDISLWEDVVSKSPRKARPHNNLGSAYKLGGFIDEALVQYQIAVGLKPDHAPSHYNLGIVYGAKGSHHEAISHYRIAVRLKPDYALAYLNLGNEFAALGSLDEAETAYQKAIDIAPALDKAHYNLGNVFLKRGLIKDAVREYETALKLNPSNLDARKNLDRAMEMQEGKE